MKKFFSLSPFVPSFLHSHSSDTTRLTLKTYTESNWECEISQSTTTVACWWWKISQLILINERWRLSRLSKVILHSLTREVRRTRAEKFMNAIWSTHKRCHECSVAEVKLFSSEWVEVPLTWEKRGWWRREVCLVVAFEWNNFLLIYAIPFAIATRFFIAKLYDRKILSNRKILHTNSSTERIFTSQNSVKKVVISMTFAALQKLK